MTSMPQIIGMSTQKACKFTDENKNVEIQLYAQEMTT